MSEDTLIRVEGVSKKFCRSLKKSLWYGMQDLGNEIRGHRHGGDGQLRADEFWAIDNVSFELKRGECLGLIGRNGAGKTTLLRILNGLIKPDCGRIEMRGRVGALIALGAGFNPILTGRENIYVNASVLGFTRQEITSKVDEIIEFSELAEFIDMPVQSYSSGMNVRLGFSIASTLNPDILLLDEVLAVGDAAFRAKCFDRVGKLLKQCGVIFVSHDSVQVSRICDKCLYLRGGSLVSLGDTLEVLERYERETLVISGSASIICNKNVEAFSISPSDFEINTGDSVPLSVSLKLKDDQVLQPSKVGLALIALHDGSTWVAQAEITAITNNGLGEGSDISFLLGPLDLRAGTYTIGITILDQTRKATIVHALNIGKITVNGVRGYGVPYQARVSQKL